tara:strand:+ start:777 stop:974 length:198 start_codon:yes stop_codon:yes gene_type:complete
MIIVPVATVFLIGILSVGGIVYFEPPECPSKYMKLEKGGGVLQNKGDIVRYCVPYGTRWTLRKND